MSHSLVRYVARPIRMGITPVALSSCYHEDVLFSSY